MLKEANSAILYGTYTPFRLKKFVKDNKGFWQPDLPLGDYQTIGISDTLEDQLKKDKPNQEAVINVIGINNMQFITNFVIELERKPLKGYKRIKEKDLY